MLYKKSKLEKPKSKLTILLNYIYISTANENNSNLEFFSLEIANIVKKLMQTSKNR